jgi:IS5 family transposase
MMFKVLVLQALYNLSDDQAEFQIRDRLSFLRFLGLTPNVPSRDAKTIWLFRKHLVQARAIEKLFALFDTRLKASGYLAQGGQIIDRKWAVTHAARHDSGAFEDVLDTGNIAQSVWADTACRSAKNEAAIRRARLKSMIHFRKPKVKPMDRRHQRANAARSKVRSAVEHVFATQKSRMALFVRTIGIERARMKIGMANLAYNFKRLVWHERRTAPA